ncbi:choline kinase [Silicimonas algicola]|uniref:Thiamine kinase-like enzyme n=1 Tax=Silicimonas algicola TaxID=1826607 RepID=A0A316FXZ6_9RHOB|nr:choline/ethanolamine kinase family protein [Silicimonas algicola]AZQ68382.1 choline kinase [Silicimonas algicola]PWK53531.1 thiamine kinase-like enzyme [Silicimonas algicola]
MTLPEAVATLPCWHGTPSGERLSGGLSNEIWKVTDDAGTHVVRLGRDYPFHHVDRAREVMTARAAHAAGFGPEVRYATPGVMVTAFIEARTWEAEDLRANPERVARLLSDFHSQMAAGISGAAFLFWPFHVVRDYARTLRGTRHESVTPPLLALSDEMERAQVPLPIVFGHHDLLPANFLDDTHRIWLIDYEYAGFGTALFDLAGAAANAEMPPDATEALLTTYFASRPDPALFRAFDAMQVAALLRETLWAYVSDLNLSAPGVDYLAYAAENRARLDAALSAYRNRWGTE